MPRIDRLIHWMERTLDHLVDAKERADSVLDCPAKVGLKHHLGAAEIFLKAALEEAHDP